MNTIIASMIMSGILPTGKERTLSIEIGTPYPALAGEWRCPVAMSGLHGNLPDIAGGDAFQSLTLALRTVQTLLGHFVADGGQLLDPETREVVSLEAYFPQKKPTSRRNSKS